VICREMSWRGGKSYFTKVHALAAVAASSRRRSRPRRSRLIEVEYEEFAARPSMVEAAMAEQCARLAALMIS